MRLLMLCAVAGLLAGCSETSRLEMVPGADWLLDYDQALKLAREKNLPVLINFTGRDWCPPCKIMRRDVFEKKEFVDYAGEHLVLLELDYPPPFARRPVSQQKVLLYDEYGIQVFPTLIVLSPAGKELVRIPTQEDIEGITSVQFPGSPSELRAWIAASQTATPTPSAAQ